MSNGSAATVKASGLLPRPGSDRKTRATKEATLKIEILYFSGCPNHAPAVDRVRDVLAEERLPCEMVEVEVKDAATAQEIGFLGSPSIRIDGLDVEPAVRGARAFGMMCRTYIDGGRRAGVPPPEWIRAALREATER
jgi:hypothetical protein